MIHMAKQNQTLFKQSGGNGGARTRTSAGVNGLAVQYARTEVRKTFSVRTAEQSLPNSLRAEKRPESFKKRHQGKKSNQLESEEIENLERRQVLERKKKASSLKA
jgi:hypothetical protein